MARTKTSDGVEINNEVGMPDAAKAIESPQLPIYDRLAAAFESVMHDSRGGFEFDYITGEQCVTRLNQVLGVAGWSFRVLEHGIHQEADECWALGEIVATIDGTQVTRQQFGSQKLKRSRTSGVPIDIGFDLKGAVTDALKKCATLIGVGLYLSHKEAQQGTGGGVPSAPTADMNIGQARMLLVGLQKEARELGLHEGPMEVTGKLALQPSSLSMEELVQAGEVLSAAIKAKKNPEDVLICEECGEALTETRFKDGTTWAAKQLAGFGRRKHSRVLCMSHYREANQAKRRADEALQNVPF